MVQCAARISPNSLLNPNSTPSSFLSCFSHQSPLFNTCLLVDGSVHSHVSYGSQSISCLDLNQGFIASLPSSELLDCLQNPDKDSSAFLSGLGSDSWEADSVFLRSDRETIQTNLEQPVSFQNRTFIIELSAIVSSTEQLSLDMDFDAGSTPASTASSVKTAPVVALASFTASTASLAEMSSVAVVASSMATTSNATGDAVRGLPDIDAALIPHGGLIPIIEPNDLRLEWTVINFSSYRLSEDQKNVLNMYVKFRQTPCQIPYLQMIASMECAAVALDQLETGDGNRFRIAWVKEMQGASKS